MEVSSPDKVLFPGDGITKAQVVDHYRAVGQEMVKWVGGRPLTVERFPRGINAKGFMQKNVADHYPDSIRRLPVPKSDGGETIYPVVDQADDLAWLANQNAITFHTWTSTADRPAHADVLVLDLDPEEDSVAQVREAALAARDVLQAFDLDASLFATGSKGFHLWVGLDGSQSYGDVGLASRALAGLAVAAEPDLLTTEFLKKNRGGRVFVDWLRNAPTATVVAPFSLRPKPGAPVAVPVTWDELVDAEPYGWHIGGIDDRLELGLHLDSTRIPVDQIVSAAVDAGVDLETPHDRFGRRR